MKILLVLLDNAVKFTEKGMITFEPYIPSIKTLRELARRFQVDEIINLLKATEEND